jgi:hypothetical protein
MDAQLIMSFENPAYPQKAVIANQEETIRKWVSEKCTYKCTGVYGGKKENSFFLTRLDDYELEWLIKMAKNAGQESVCLDVDGLNTWYLLYVNGPNEGKLHRSLSYTPGASLQAIGNPTDYTVIHYPGFDFYMTITFDFSELQEEF